MNVLEWLKRAFVPLKRVDPRFGEMTFQRMGGEQGPSYWEGSGSFAGREIEFFVDGEEAGPSAAQRALCDAIERHWSAIEPRLALFLERNATEEDLGDSSRKLADWSLGSLTIKAVGASVPRYEIGYVEIDGGELLDFEMEGHEPHALRTGG